MTDLEQLIAEEKAKIVAETATIHWQSLEKFYAQGKLILVQDGLNLVEVAYSLSLNETDDIESLVEDEQLSRDFNEQARLWHQDDAEVWCVVVKPWILVQAITR
jgi:hypothetical protein